MAFYPQRAEKFQYSAQPIAVNVVTSNDDDFVDQKENTIFCIAVDVTVAYADLLACLYPYAGTALIVIGALPLCAIAAHFQTIYFDMMALMDIDSGEGV